MVTIACVAQHTRSAHYPPRSQNRAIRVNRGEAPADQAHVGPDCRRRSSPWSVHLVCAREESHCTHLSRLTKPRSECYIRALLTGQSSNSM